MGNATESREVSAGTSPAAQGSDRYSRQVLFGGVGEVGQQRIRQAHVGLIGCGATGAASAGMLVRAGLGQLTLIDRDFVEESNLQRQVLFDEADAREGLPKAEAARRKLAAINSEVSVHAHVTDLTPANIALLLADCDLLLDATDNYETRFLVNDYAVSTGKPWIYAAAVGAYAAGLNVLPGETACLACLFPSMPTGAVETCETAGILNSVANVAASIQVTEALKLLAGKRQSLRRTLLAWDLWANERSEIAAGAPRKDCEVCGERKFRHLAGEGRPQITLCGRNAVQIHEHHRPLDLVALRERLAALGQVRGNDLLVRFQPSSVAGGGPTLHIFADGRALIQGTTEPGLARSLYARYVGS
jgi:adenylyltransferase/sulfurtransferase